MPVRTRYSSAFWTVFFGWSSTHLWIVIQNCLNALTPHPQFLDFNIFYLNLSGTRPLKIQWYISGAVHQTPRQFYRLAPRKATSETSVTTWWLAFRNSCHIHPVYWQTREVSEGSGRLKCRLSASNLKIASHWCWVFWLWATIGESCS